MSSLLHYREFWSALQMPFFVGELAELFDVLLMLSTAPMLWEGDSGLKLQDLIVEVSRWVLGPRFFSTVDLLSPLQVRRRESLNHY